MTHETLKDIAQEGIKAAPPVAVVTTAIAKDWTMSHTVAALTIVYLVLQIAWLLWRWHKAAKGHVVHDPDKHGGA